MERDLFIWTLCTALVAFLLSFVVGIFTTNDLFAWLLIIATYLIATYLYLRKDQASPFTTGATFGLAILTAVLISGKAVQNNVEAFFVYIAIFGVTFVASGGVALLLKKMKKN